MDQQLFSSFPSFSQHLKNLETPRRTLLPEALAAQIAQHSSPGWKPATPGIAFSTFPIPFHPADVTNGEHVYNIGDRGRGRLQPRARGPEWLWQPGGGRSSGAPRPSRASSTGRQVSGLARIVAVGQHRQVEWRSGVAVSPADQTNNTA